MPEQFQPFHNDQAIVPALHLTCDFLRAPEPYLPQEEVPRFVPVQEYDGLHIVPRLMDFHASASGGMRFLRIAAHGKSCQPRQLLELPRRIFIKKHSPPSFALKILGLEFCRNRFPEEEIDNSNMVPYWKGPVQSHFQGDTMSVQQGYFNAHSIGMQATCCVYLEISSPCAPPASFERTSVPSSANLRVTEFYRLIHLIARILREYYCACPTFF